MSPLKSKQLKRVICCIQRSFHLLMRKAREIMPLFLLERMRRAQEARSVPRLDPGRLYGEQGEQEVARTIDRLPGSFRIANPIVQGTRTRSKVFEADHFV
jgi:hypothetical protein